jgi:DNA replication protein DnaC
MADLDTLTFEDRLALLIEREITFRDDRRLTRLLQVAKLQMPACVEDLDFRTPRGLDRSLVLRLASGQWIREHDNLLICGATGTRKSYLACAFGHSACRQGLSTRYFRFSRLLGELALARADGSYPKLLDRLARTQLLVLDDFGLAPLSDPERRDLLEVLDDRYAKRATLVTSQLPFDHWHDVLGDATFADAILDRLVHNAHRITLNSKELPCGGRRRPKPLPPKPSHLQRRYAPTWTEWMDGLLRNSWTTSPECAPRGRPQSDLLFELLDQTPAFDPAEPDPVPDFDFDQPLPDHLNP